MVNELEGTVSIDGLCEEAPCSGKLELKYFSEQKIKYTFEFEAAGEDYIFIGEKRNIYPWNLPYSHTFCFESWISTVSSVGKVQHRSD
jgi:hypothetical protein